MSTIDRLLLYGVSSTLADKAVSAGLTASQLRQLSKKDLVAKFGLDGREADALRKSVRRAPIDKDVAHLLLSASNHRCCVCRGDTDTADSRQPAHRSEISTWGGKCPRAIFR